MAAEGMKRAARKAARTPKAPIIRVNKSRRLKYGSTITIPLLDPRGYRRFVQEKRIWTFPPSSDLMEYAIKNRLLDKVVLGLQDNEVVEGLLLDEETGIPWQVSKVIVQYNQIDYTSRLQPHAQKFTPLQEPPISPGADCEFTLKTLEDAPIER